MEDLVRRSELVDALSRATESWAHDVQGIRAWWPHAVKIKDNILYEIKKLEAVPVADKEKMIELLEKWPQRDFGYDLHVEIAEYLMANSAVFATSHVPLEQKVRSECPSPDYCNGWNAAVKQMEGSFLQAMPCNVGDKLWLNVEKVCIGALNVEEIRFRKDGCVISLESGALVAEIMAEDIGKTAFFSEKEARAALESELGIVDELLAKAVAICEDVNKDSAYQKEYARRMAGSWLDWEEFDRETGLLAELSY